MPPRADELDLEDPYQEFGSALRASLLALMILGSALAASAEGAPDFVSVLSGGAVLGILAALGRYTPRMRAFRVHFAVAAVFLSITFTAFVYRTQNGQPLWLLLAGLPLSSAIPAQTLRRLTVRRDFQEMLFVPLSAGLIAALSDPSANPWLYWPYCGVLLYRFLLIFHVWAMYAAPLREMRIPVEKKDLSTLMRSSLRSTLGCTLLAALLFEGATHLFPPRPSQVVERTIRRPADATLSAEESESWLKPSTGSLALARLSFDPTPIAWLEIRRSNAEDAATLPPLYLSRLWLENAAEIEGSLWLTRKDEPDKILRDEDDDTTDGRIFLDDRRFAEFQPREERLVQTLTLLEEGIRALWLLPYPLWVELAELQRTAGAELLLPEGVSFYRAGCERFSQTPSSQRPDARSECRSLPADFPDRSMLATVVAEVTGRERDPWKRLALLESWFQRNSQYSLSDPWPGSHAAFLEQRKGSCLSFAQCFAVLARIAGLPARVVVGYRVDEWTAERRAYLVRRSDSHAWVEILLSGGGSRVVDPTPSMELDLATAASVDALLSGKEGASLLSEQEFRSLKRKKRIQWMAIFLGSLAVAYLLLPERLRGFMIGRASAPTARQFKELRRAWRLWQGFLDLCARFNLVKHPAATASEFVGSIEARIPERASELHRLLNLYYRCRFGGGDLNREIEGEWKRHQAQVAEALHDGRDRLPAAAD